MSNSTGKTHMFTGADTAFYLGGAERLTGEKIKETNDAVMDKQASVFNQGVQRKLEHAKEMNEFLSGCTIKPLNSYMLVKPCKENPFKTMTVTKSGIVISPYEGTFINPDSGEKDRMAPVTDVAVVVDPGEFNDANVGDYVFYRSMASTEVPFMQMGYEVVAHQNLICIVKKNK